MTSTPNTVSQALAFLREEHRNPSKSWKGLCQELVRTALGQPYGKYGSAWKQWQNTPANRKHEGGNPAHAPVGAALCYKGAGPNGHIMIACHPFPNGTPAAWSNDLVKPGKVNKVPRTAPTKIWGQKYLGYITNVNDKDIVKRI
jgi:hypothetical protein